jgi:hypothetical protein
MCVLPLILLAGALRGLEPSPGFSAPTAQGLLSFASSHFPSLPLQKPAAKSGCQAGQHAGHS